MNSSSPNIQYHRKGRIAPFLLSGLFSDCSSGLSPALLSALLSTRILPSADTPRHPHLLLQDSPRFDVNQIRMPASSQGFPHLAHGLGGIVRDLGNVLAAPAVEPQDQGAEDPPCRQS